MPEIPAEPIEPGRPGRYRRAAAATLPTLKFAPALITAFAVFGVVLALSAGIGVLRGLWQGAVFGIIATIAGASFTFFRFAVKPELLEGGSTEQTPRQR